MKFPVSLRSFCRLFLHTQMLPVLESGEETLVGGQAVMEGVMMRAPHSYCVAVRKPSGEMVTEAMPCPAHLRDVPDLQAAHLPRHGHALPGHEAGRPGAAFFRRRGGTGRSAAAPAGKAPKEMPGWAVTGNLIFAAGLPVSCTSSCRCFWRPGSEKSIPSLHGRFAFNIVDGVIRIAIFLGFLYAISRIKDIRRVFEYHGAEHKVVFNFESGQPVTVRNAQKFTHVPSPLRHQLPVRADVRLAIPVYALHSVRRFRGQAGLRIALLPLMVGVSYELIRFAARHPGWLVGHPDRARSVAAAHHHQAAVRRPGRGGHPALDGAMALEEAQGGELVIA